jgi:hypothetical protein
MADPFRYRGFPVDLAHQTAPVGQSRTALIRGPILAPGTVLAFGSPAGSARGPEPGAMLAFGSAPGSSRSGARAQLGAGRALAFGSPAGAGVTPRRADAGRWRCGSTGANAAGEQGGSRQVTLRAATRAAGLHHGRGWDRTSEPLACEVPPGESKRGAKSGSNTEDSLRVGDRRYPRITADSLRV